MTDLERGQNRAAVIDLQTRRPAAPVLPDGGAVDLRKGDTVVSSDTHYEHALDDEPTPGGEPVLVDGVLGAAGERRPIIPPHLRGVANIKATVKDRAAIIAHHAGVHAVRLPFWYLPAGVFWAVIAVFKLTYRQVRWWWLLEQHSLRQNAADTNDAKAWALLHREAKTTRAWRGIVLLAELFALVIAVLLLVFAAPIWVVAAVALVVVPVLAHFGRPPNKPIISAAIVAPRFRRINPDIVLRAYYAAGLGHPEKADQQVKFGSTMSRDAMNTGSQVIVDLPFGKTFAEAVKLKVQLASGLDVTEYQVFLTRDKTSTRRHLLFVADRNPLAIPAGSTPMLDCKVRDIWKPCLLGLDERGRKVLLDLMWQSVLVGAQPRKGKTFTARLLAIYAALDPYVKLFIADGKNSPDWRMFALVAERMVFGTAPTARDGDPIDRLLDMLRHIKRHIQRVNEILSKLPIEQCPEGKLTRELARDLRYPELRVWLLVIEEFQLYFETDDQETNKEIAGLLSYIKAVGPSAGVILVSSSQKPSGVGAGDVQRLFNRYRDNHDVRIALKCGNRDVSMAVLGGDAYQEGYDASALPNGPEYRGVGYLYGASDHTPLTRFHLATGPDAEFILRAARKQRERLGTLTGQAAGDVVFEGELIDPLADALSVIAATEANISWPRLAARLAEQMPERYEDITADAVSARLRALGAKGKGVADTQFFPSGRGQGVARAQLEELTVQRTVSR